MFPAILHAHGRRENAFSVPEEVAKREQRENENTMFWYVCFTLCLDSSDAVEHLSILLILVLYIVYCLLCLLK